jgi:hypothetical protein
VVTATAVALRDNTVGRVGVAVGAHQHSARVAAATEHDVNPARPSQRSALPEISGNIRRGTENPRRKGPTRQAIFGKVIVYARVIA